MSKWEMLEELQKVEKKGAGATIPYVYSESPLVFQRHSSSYVFSRNLANHWPSQSARVQLVNVQPQHALPITIPSQYTPTELTPTALAVLASLGAITCLGRPRSTRNGRGTRPCAQLLYTRSVKEKKAARQKVITSNHAPFWFRIH